MKPTHFIFTFLFFLLSATAGAQPTPDKRLPIGVRTEHTGIARIRTYQYGLAENLELYQVLPVVAQNGTARQRRKASRLQRNMAVSSALNLVGLAGTASAGFFAPTQLAARQRIYATGGGLILLNLAFSAIQSGRARRLVRAYNDTLLARQEAYVRSGADIAALTLADTVALSKNLYSYRGMAGVLPTRTSNFNWEDSKPRFGFAGILGMGAAFVGAAILSVNSFRAVQRPGDFRRGAWTGAGLTGVGFSLAIPVGRANLKRKKATIEQYNRFVRENAIE